VLPTNEVRLFVFIDLVDTLRRVVIVFINGFPSDKTGDLGGHVCTILTFPISGILCEALIRNRVAIDIHEVGSGRKILKVEASEAVCTPEKDIVSVVDKPWWNRVGWVFPTVIFPFFLLLCRGLACAKRSAAVSCLFAILALGLIRSGRLLFAWKGNTASALKDEVAVSNLCDQMFSVRAVTEAILMVCKSATLAVDERSIVRTIAASVALLNMTGSERIGTGQISEDFFGANGFWRSCWPGS